MKPLMKFSGLLGGLCFCVTANVFAQETRVQSMGGVGNFMKDLSNVNTFIGTLADYPSLTSIEIRQVRNYDAYSFGLHLPLKNNVLGVYLNRPTESDYFAFSGLGQTILNNQSEILLGGKTSNGSYGLGFTFANDSRSSDTDFRRFSDQSMTDFGAKVGYSFGSNEVALRANFISNEFLQADTINVFVGGTTSDAVNSLVSEGNGVEIDFKYRFWKDYSKVVKIVPVISVNYQNSNREESEIHSSSGTTDSQKTEFDYSKVAVGFGVGFNHQINEDNLLVVAVEAFSYQRRLKEFKSGDETEIINLVYPSFFVGAESKIFSWLIGRFGVNQLYGNVKEKSKTNFLSGADENLSSRVSLTYKF